MKIVTGFLLPGILAALTLAACASESIVMVNPRTGATVKCGASGSGLMAGMAAGAVEECRQKYGPQGYVAAERLTPGERADLERRGVSLP
ncbi:MAG TPA: hypothetical protein VGA73_12585 [Candidatus Binatia bacterium]